VRLETEGVTLLDVVVDPLQIEQVLLDVVLNAIQASPAGTRILIRDWQRWSQTFGPRLLPLASRLEKILS
jgi:signal transduction histidine kinase